MRLSAVLIFLALSATADADNLMTEFGGHTKFRAVGQSYPENSLFRDFVGSDLLDVGADLRLNLKLNSGNWTFDTAYQLVGLQGDGLKLTGPPNDDRRLLDLTHIISEGSDSAILHRLDRLWLGYTSEKAVVRLGRQALSWGNGLAYAPMDLVNPFDPASIDTEYKAGDDMLYVQYLQDNGNDVQAAYVFRRDLVTGERKSDEATAAIKYHGFAGEAEYDLLVASSYGDAVIGIGTSRGIGGAVWSADLVVTETERDTYVQFVTNTMYSWIWGGKNMSGSLEYYFNGIGQSDGRYDPTSLASNPDLLARVTRGELFTLGRHYLSANVMIEMSPLWVLTPTVFMNVEDPSALFQLVTTYSLSDNMTLLGSVNIPVGPSGTEFGGVESGLPDRYLSTDMGFFAQFAWYF
jgi:hypothetical protein